MPRQTRASAAKAAEKVAKQLSSPPETPAPPTQRARKQPARKNAKPEPVSEPTSKSTSLTTPASTRKRAHAPEQDSEDDTKIFDELPHNLGPIPAQNDDEPPPAKKRSRRPAKVSQVKSEPEESKVAEVKPDVIIATPESDEAGNPAQAKKKNKYGFMPGETPYPDYAHPTAEECYEVNRILSKVHGKVTPPEKIPVPSVTVAGCGEVPSVLDALIRTRLSAATTGANSSRAFQGLVKTYGTIKEGVGKGSVDWNAVRLSSQDEVCKAIESGGLGPTKSKDIKAILDLVYTENQARKAALTSSAAPDPKGAENEAQETKDFEVAHAEADVLSLDHMHVMHTQDALDQLVSYPGIGMKTAACVALFCLRRSCFAVDTHVFRLCQYLGWVPTAKDIQPGQAKVTRNTAYTHCEARIPDELKYSLHQLLIKHGKVCPRCRASTGTTSENWAKGCPIEHLVTRYGAKKGGDAVAGPTKKAPKKAGAGKAGGKAAKKAPAKKGKKAVESEDEELSELSELEDDESED